MLAAGCSFDYIEAGPSPDELLELAETEFTDVTRTIVHDGRVVTEIQAHTLRWEDQRRRLVTAPEAVVEILRDDGSRGARLRPGGGRAAQDDPLHRPGQRHPGHPDQWFRTAVRDRQTQAGEAPAPFDDGRRVRGGSRSA